MIRNYERFWEELQISIPYLPNVAKWQQYVVAKATNKSDFFLFILIVFACFVFASRIAYIL